MPRSIRIRIGTTSCLVLETVTHDDHAWQDDAGSGHQPGCRHQCVHEVVVVLGGVNSPVGAQNARRSTGDTTHDRRDMTSHPDGLANGSDGTRRHSGQTDLERSSQSRPLCGSLAFKARIRRTRSTVTGAAREKGQMKAWTLMTTRGVRASHTHTLRTECRRRPPRRRASGMPAAGLGACSTRSRGSAARPVR